MPISYERPREASRPLGVGDILAEPTIDVEMAWLQPIVRLVSSISVFKKLSSFELSFFMVKFWLWRLI